VSALLPEATTAWLLSTGKVGHDVPSRGVLEALGASIAVKALRPRRPFRMAAPWGPADPRDVRDILRPPYPDLAVASGRQTVPSLRALKRLSPATFTVFMGDPRTGRTGADLTWAPRHDGLVGPGVVTTLTAPHPFGAARLAALRSAGAPAAVAVLPHPRVAVMLGGPSHHHPFGAADQAGLVEAVAAIAVTGAGVMVTPSRRTPPGLMQAIGGRLGPGASAVLWDGSGANPYAQFLAFAEAILVTGDSTNMIGEACATGAPVHVFDLPEGGHRKIRDFVDHLVEAGVARRWAGRLEHWTYRPIDSTREVAEAIAERFAAMRHAGVASRR
jgi:mitochondrial fission protein ELM1